MHRALFLKFLYVSPKACWESWLILYGLGGFRNGRICAFFLSVYYGTCKFCSCNKMRLSPNVVIELILSLKRFKLSFKKKLVCWCVFRMITLFACRPKKQTVPFFNINYGKHTCIKIETLAVSVCCWELWLCKCGASKSKLLKFLPFDSKAAQFAEIRFDLPTSSSNLKQALLF